MAEVKMLYGLQASYDKITAKDVNTVYFCTDTQRLFKGDTEYSRPVKFGATLPTAFLPPNSLFYNTAQKALYFSQDGTKWTAVSNFYTHPSFTAKVVGANTAGQVEFGGTIKIPKITVDNQGHVSAAEDIGIQLPMAPEDIKNKVTVTGTGNAVTAATMDTAGHTLTLTKGETFATKSELQTAIGKITSFELDAGPEGAGYATLAALKAAHPTGTKGTLYLVKGKAGTSNVFEEYFWTGKAYERAGTFGDVDLSGYVPTTRKVAGKPLTGDVTLAKSDVGLANVDNTADAAKNVLSATKLTTKRQISLSGDATGSVQFDGSANAEIAVTVKESAHAAAADHATAADSATNATHANSADNATTASSANTAKTATSATNATNDGNGKNIANTYATKAELQNSKLVWGTF